MKLRGARRLLRLQSTCCAAQWVVLLGGSLILSF